MSGRAALSPRLAMAAGLVPGDRKNIRLADIGTDHAYLPVWLLQNRGTDLAHVIAADLRPGPLDRARQTVRAAGLEGAVRVASAATSTEEIGNPVYPPARRKLAEHQIGCAGKTARQLREEDYQAYDYLVGMDHANLRNMRRMLGGDPEGKLSLLLDHAGRPGEEIADPWYTGDFEETYQDVLAGCQGLLDQIRGTLHP